MLLLEQFYVVLYLSTKIIQALVLRTIQVDKDTLCPLKATFFNQV